MANKFYAVKNGRKIGVFKTWEECKEQTQGFSNAIFKSFKTEEEAVEFLEFENNFENVNTCCISDIFNRKDNIKSYDKDIESIQKKSKKEYHDSREEIFKSIDTETMIAYIDGSYDDEIKYFSYAGIMFYKNQSEDFAFSSCDEELVLMRNVSGEVKASMYVMQKAKEYSLKKIVIYYDYSGIENWAKGNWKTNNHLTKSYRDFYLDMSKSMEISFVKVKSHTNIKYNEYVDKLAKRAIEDIKKQIDN